MKDGRTKNPLIFQAICTRLRFALGEKGYYDEKNRKLPLLVRTKVIERDGGLCCTCGANGSEIDHIEGNSNSLDNLQLLCNDCHRKKTQNNIIEITSDDPYYPEFQIRKNNLRSRIDSTEPQRACDDESNWNTLFQQIMAGQRELLKRIKEDFLGLSKNKDPLEEARIRRELDELNELKLQIKTLELQKQAQIDQILTPEINSKLKEIELRFIQAIENIKESIEILEKRIKGSVIQYGSTIKGISHTVVYVRGRISWDSKGLEEYAKSNPEILKYRSEGTVSAWLREKPKIKTANRFISEEAIDNLVVAQADEDNAWEEPIQVKRKKEDS